MTTFKKLRLLGASALSLAYASRWRADAYWENNIKIRGVAAGMAIVRAAGAKLARERVGDSMHLNVKAFYAHLLDNAVGRKA